MSLIQYICVFFQGGPKPGSITQGYPRGQQQPQQQPPPASQMHYARHRY